MTKEWDDVMLDIKNLYVVKGKSLTYIMGYLKKRGFEASTRSYRKKIKEWGLRRRSRAQPSANPAAAISPVGAKQHLIHAITCNDLTEAEDILNAWDYANCMVEPASKMTFHTLAGGVHTMRSGYPLHFAIIKGSPEMVDLLLRKGAAGSINSSSVVSCEECGLHPSSALRLAVFCNKPEIVDRIFEAEPHAKDSPGAEPTSQRGRHCSLDTLSLALMSSSSALMLQILTRNGRNINDLNHQQLELAFKYHKLDDAAKLRQLKKLLYLFNATPTLRKEPCTLFIRCLMKSRARWASTLTAMEEELVLVLIKRAESLAFQVLDSNCPYDGNFAHVVLHHTPVTPESKLARQLVTHADMNGSENSEILLGELLRPCPSSQMCADITDINVSEPRSRDDVSGVAPNNLCYRVDTLRLESEYLLLLDLLFANMNASGPKDSPYYLSMIYLVKRFIKEPLALHIGERLVRATSLKVVAEYVGLPESANWNDYLGKLTDAELPTHKAAFSVQVKRFLQGSYDNPTVTASEIFEALAACERHNIQLGEISSRVLSSLRRWSTRSSQLRRGKPPCWCPAYGHHVTMSSTP